MRRITLTDLIEWEAEARNQAFRLHECDERHTERVSVDAELLLDLIENYNLKNEVARRAG